MSKVREALKNTRTVQKNSGTKKAKNANRGKNSSCKKCVADVCIWFGSIGALFAALKTRTKIFTLLGIIVMAFVFVALYLYLSRPQNYVSGDVQNPSVSAYSDGKIYPSAFTISFSAPVAKLDLADKKIDTPIKIFPDVAGTWEWVGQSSLKFTPSADWAPATTYKVTLPKSIFDAAYDIKPLTYKITTPPFSAQFTQKEFYEDPTNPKIKRVTATVEFSHPVDLEDLKKNISAKTAGGQEYQITVTPGALGRSAYLVSDPIKIGAEEDFLTLSIKKVKNRYNNQTLENKIQEKITIPSASTFFKINGMHTDIVLNQDKENEAEQIVFVDFSTAVSSDELADYFNLYTYSDSCWRFEEAYKKLKNTDAHPTAVKGVRPLPFTALPIENESAKVHTFKYTIQNPKNVCVIGLVTQGLKSADDFELGQSQMRTMNAARFPSEVKIAFDGSLLSFTGDKRLSFTSRGLEKAKATLARIPAKSINHLVSQTYGAFDDPSFKSYSFNADNIAENFEETILLNFGAPQKQNYASVDLNKYFQNKKGIFIATIEGYRQGESYASTKDARLVTVTNLGIIVKENKDKTSAVFVSDFANGHPVSNAKVEVIGKNGVPVLTRYTDNNGYAAFPNLSDFKREKEPVAYVVTKGEDVSFMPIGRYDRQLNLSRFDVDGTYAPTDMNTLKAYVFSDRGVYRPSETAYFGIIVRNADLKTPTHNEIKVDIRDSAYNSVYSKKISVPSMGYLEMSFNIGSMAKTGTYTVDVSTLKDGRYYQSIGETTIKVEEFTPETMRIQTAFINAPLKGWINAETLKASVTLENLYGTPANGNTVKGEAVMIPSEFKFSKFPGFQFDDPLRVKTQTPLSVKNTLPSQTTDLNGQAFFDIDLSSYAKGTYRVIFTADGLEGASGRSVAAQTTALVSPLDYLVGSKKDGDFDYVHKNADRFVTFMPINPQLEQIDLKDVELQVFESKFVSTLVKQPNGTYKYQSVEKKELKTSTTIDLPKEGLKYKLDTQTPGHYFVRLEKDGTVLSQVPYTVAGSSNVSYALDKNAELVLKLNKAEYNGGDEIEMQITAPYTGYGLITIEKDAVVAYKWFKADTASTTQHITLPDWVEGNAYVNVAFVRDLESKEIFMSPLSYAAVPFSVNKAKRTLKIDLEVPALVKPGDTLTVTYKAAQKGKIIVYGVNEGILSYAKYKLPDPLAAFMPKQALQVNTFQIMDLILPDTKLLKNRSTTGGDSEAQAALARNLNPFARKTDKPVAFFSGIMTVDENEKTYTYTVPDNFNGQIRVMAVAVSDTAFGSIQSETLVRGDFAMTPSAPFNVNPGDEFEVGTAVTNMVDESKVLNATVSLTPSENFEIIGNASQTAELIEGVQKSFKFKIKALPKLGDGTLTFTVKSGAYESKMSIHTGIRPSMPYTSDIKSGYADKEITLKDFSLDLYDEYQTKQIDVSTSPLVLARSLVQYLDKYPYGCTEQTVSRAFPMIAMLFERPQIVKGVDVYDLFDKAINILKMRQTPRGGFTPWTSAGGEINDFDSIYAFHFLNYAKERDFDVPETLINRAADYMKEIARTTPQNEAENLNVAYAIYTLTLSGEVTTNYLINLENTLSQDKNWKKSLAAAYVAASYQLLGNAKKARQVLGDYQLGTDVVQDARYIYLMALHFADEFAAIREKGVDVLLRPLKNGQMNSISSAYSILALSAYPAAKEADKEIRFSVPGGIYGDFATLDFSKLPANKALKITSPRPFYYTITNQGFEVQLPKTAVAKGIEVVKEIQNAKGETINTAALGEEVTVKLRVRSKAQAYITDVAVVDLVPGCFEIMPDSIQTSYLDSFEVREDRAVFYLTATRDMVEISYKAKTIAKGDFVVPPTYASALYDWDVKANTVPGRLKVDE